MIDQALNTIQRNNLINKGDRVVVGVSGGPDSVCLLHILYSLAQKLDASIYAIHINHMLRGSESDRDEEYVRNLCMNLGVDLKILKIDVSEISRKTNSNLEETGRDIRYCEFEKYADETGAERIAVGHNRNDQAETILMHIIRGMGIDGLKGMDYKRGKIIRPLLDVERIRIEEYCLKNNLSPRIDRTNLEYNYTRNKIRLGLIPYINDKFSVDIIDKLSILSGLARDDLDFMEGSTSNMIKNVCVEEDEDGIVFETILFTEMHPAIRKRGLRNAYKALNGNYKGLESTHIDKIADLISNGKTGSEINLPNGIIAQKSYDTFKLVKKAAKNEMFCFEKPLEIPGLTCIDEINASVEAVLEEFTSIRETCRPHNFQEQLFDYEKLKMGINIRSRRNGDIFKPAGSNGTKKLKEYFIDKKIPRESRDRIPLIAKGNEIIWVVGDKISDKFKVTEDTKTVLKIRVSRGRDY